MGGDRRPVAGGASFEVCEGVGVPKGVVESKKFRRCGEFEAAIRQVSRNSGDERNFAGKLRDRRIDRLIRFVGGEGVIRRGDFRESRFRPRPTFCVLGVFSFFLVNNRRGTERAACFYRI